MSNTTKSTKTTRKPSETTKQPKARGILPNDQWLKASDMIADICPASFKSL